VIRIGFILSLIAAALLLAGPIGTRVGLWPFLIGFLMMALSLLLGLAGASLSLVGGLKTGQWSWALVSIIVGLAVVSVPSAVILSARGKPPIHDITTDVENPPPFVAVLPLRAGAANPPDYAGADVAAQQRRAYPDIQPLVLRAPADDVFDRALSVIRELGWEAVASDRTAGRIEAVDTTFWFGFKDDVVIRIAGQPDGTTRMDVRSTSRVGVGDVGTNARRIRTLLDRMQAAS
jgi:uncharacterized protein (DUF1499 family)